MTLIWSTRFRKEFTALPGAIKERARKQLALFSRDPGHPSLRTKKMEGGDIWEGRVSQGYRFTFTISGDTYVLRRVGPHDILKRP